jgi:hypothetical protein
VNGPTSDEFQEVRRPIASLISKSEKAQQRLAPGTWQHSMLRDNLKALHIASTLMGMGTSETDNVTLDDMQAALGAFSSMINRTEKAHPKFSPGTSQHSLLGNRLKALRIAEALTKAELDKRLA